MKALLLFAAVCGVSDPVEVRYNWGGLGAGNLWNEGGLPVSPFTTEK